MSWILATWVLAPTLFFALVYRANTAWDRALRRLTRKGLSMKTKLLILLIVALACVACVPPPNSVMLGTHSAQLEANRQKVIGLYGIWGPAVAKVPYRFVAADVHPENAAWFNDPEGTVSFHDDDYATSVYIVAHELAHALGWDLCAHQCFVPAGWTLGIERWADCTALAIGAVRSDVLAQQTGEYGCPEGGADQVAAILHITRAPEPPEESHTVVTAPPGQEPVLPIGATS